MYFCQDQRETQEVLVVLVFVVILEMSDPQVREHIYLFHTVNSEMSYKHTRYNVLTFTLKFC